MTQEHSYHHGNLREELLAAALGLLDQEGIAVVGVRQLAKRVGVAHSAPANHFKNKQALHHALHQSVVEHFIEAVRAGMKRKVRHSEPLKQFALTILNYGLDYPHRYRLIWQSQYPLSEAMEEIYDLLTGLLKEHARLKQVDVESQAIAIWSMVHGYVVLRLDGHLQTGQEELTGQARELAILDVMLDGIRSQSGAV